MRYYKEIPHAFLEFASKFHQDIWSIHGGDEEIIRGAINSMNEPDRVSLLSYLDDLFSDINGDIFFADVWNTASANFFISKEESARKFLEYSRGVLRENLNKFHPTGYN